MKTATVTAVWFLGTYSPQFSQATSHWHLPDCGRSGSSHSGLQGVLEVVLRSPLKIQSSVLSKTAWLIPYILPLSASCTGPWQALQSSVWYVCCRKISFHIQTAKQAPIVAIVHTCWTVFPELLPSYLQVCLTQVNSMFLDIVSSPWSELCASSAQSFLSVVSTSIIDKQA